VGWARLLPHAHYPTRRLPALYRRRRQPRGEADGRGNRSTNEGASRGSSAFEENKLQPQNRGRTLRCCLLCRANVGGALARCHPRPLLRAACCSCAGSSKELEKRSTYLRRLLVLQATLLPVTRCGSGLPYGATQRRFTGATSRATSRAPRELTRMAGIVSRVVYKRSAPGRWVSGLAVSHQKPGEGGHAAPHARKAWSRASANISRKRCGGGMPGRTTSFAGAGGNRRPLAAGIACHARFARRWRGRASANGRARTLRHKKRKKRRSTGWRYANIQFLLFAFSAVPGLGL